MLQTFFHRNLDELLSFVPPCASVMLDPLDSDYILCETKHPMNQATQESMKNRFGFRKDIVTARYIRIHKGYLAK